jgi:hypothetical protein
VARNRKELAAHLQSPCHHQQLSLLHDDPADESGKQLPGKNPPIIEQPSLGAEAAAQSMAVCRNYTNATSSTGHELHKSAAVDVGRNAVGTGCTNVAPATVNVVSMQSDETDRAPVTDAAIQIVNPQCVQESRLSKNTNTTGTAVGPAPINPESTGTGNNLPPAAVDQVGEVLGLEPLSAAQTLVWRTVLGRLADAAASFLTADCHSQKSVNRALSRFEKASGLTAEKTILTRLNPASRGPGETVVEEVVQLRYGGLVVVGRGGTRQAAADSAGRHFLQRCQAVLRQQQQLAANEAGCRATTVAAAADACSRGSAASTGSCLLNVKDETAAAYRGDLVQSGSRLFVGGEHQLEEMKKNSGTSTARVATRTAEAAGREDVGHRG